jgi:3-deoxy-manno-octulosonate cytidylyltransferase (CMP-KDO synthetase)
MAGAAARTVALAFAPSVSDSPHVLAVIPARDGARRFPGKPLADLEGRPIVQWVYDAAVRCPAFDDVIVATDTERIADAVRGFGGHVEMTGVEHPSGTDRVAEVAERHADADVVVNVQGDQPFATPEMLTTLVEPYLASESPPMATLACPIADEAAWEDPNVVKVVCDQQGYALYFSRSPIPHRDPGAPIDGLHHLGLYAFTRDTVLRFPSLEETELEGRERLEQLRALEHGIRIRVSLTDWPVLEVNTPEDLERAHELLAERR